MKNIIAAALAAGIVLGTAHVASATELYFDGSVFGGTSTWGLDPKVEGALRTGFEFANVGSIELQGRMGYAAVDQRMLMLVGLGTRLCIPIEPFTPYLRLSLIHAHESPVAAMEHDPVMHLLGVGDGIRHRFGFEGGIGAKYTFLTVNDDVAIDASAEALVDGFPDDGKGPQLYGSAGLGLGLEYSL
jgi:hypothetical protein